MTVLSASEHWYGWRACARGADPQSTSDADVKADIMVPWPRVSGYAVEITANDNTLVKTGQVPVRLDPCGYRAAAVRARATLARDEATWEQARQKRALQEQRIRVL